MCAVMQLMLLAEDAEERVNITPVLMRFLGKFFLIFAAVAVIAILTPRLAEWVDRLRERGRKDAPPEDPRCRQVRGPYDMPEPPEEERAMPDEICDDDGKPPYQPKH